MIIRDPLWNNIRVDALALQLVDTPVFQRLRYVRQLGLAYLVYPGATHTRFEHALGAYHLARLTLSLLDERGELVGVTQRRAARSPSRRTAARRRALSVLSCARGDRRAAPRGRRRPASSRGRWPTLLTSALGATAPERVLALIRGTSESPLQGLISGSLDLDKIEYLKRDALMCGVPYGEIDVDRLLNSLVLVNEPDSGRRVGRRSRERACRRSSRLLFAKYQMYRNVYWHHAVRSATAMYKRLVEEALARGRCRRANAQHIRRRGTPPPLGARGASPLLSALRERRLYKRVLECPAAELPDERLEWIADDRALTIEMEDRFAAELGLAPGELLLDFPVKTQMLGLDLPVQRRSGDVGRLTTAGLEGVINLPMLSEQLYRSARWLRVFAARRIDVPRNQLLDQLLRVAGSG